MHHVTYRHWLGVVALCTYFAKCHTHCLSLKVKPALVSEALRVAIEKRGLGTFELRALCNKMYAAASSIYIYKFVLRFVVVCVGEVQSTRAPRRPR